MRKSDTTSKESLRAEHRRIERRGRLRWFQWAIVVLVTTLTLLAWRTSSVSLAARAEQSFDAHSGQAVALLTERLASHADLLRASAAFVAAGGTLSPDGWQRYADSHELDERFPAMDRLGVAYHVPDTDLGAFLEGWRTFHPAFRLFPALTGPVHLPLMLAAPGTPEDSLVGFDLAHDTVRRDAVARAIERRSVQMSAPIDLPDGEGRGFVMVAPFSRQSVSGQDGPGEERPGGVTIASVRAADLFGDGRAPDARHVLLHVSDRGETLYDERDAATADAARAPRRTLTLSLYGRDWRVEMLSGPALDAFPKDAAPRYILVGGLLLGALLMVLFTTLSGTYRRCLSFAERTGTALLAKQTELELCNAELESFAQIVSHDLKTPLNGVLCLAEFIEEDLEDYGHNAEARARVRAHVEGLKRQAARGHALIRGVLEYSEAGETTSTEEVNLGLLLEDIEDALGLEDGLLVYGEDLPVLTTSRTRLGQVLTNLVGNAVKHHHRPLEMRVEVRVERCDSSIYRFWVSDDGPGIEAEHHERVFALFDTLGSGDDVDSTGVGLAIVKKAIEGLGGSIGVESTPGGGATFVFDWPTCPALPVALPRAA